MGNVWGVLEGARQLHLHMDGRCLRTHHVQVRDLQTMLVWWPPNWTFPENPFRPRFVALEDGATRDGAGGVTSRRQDCQRDDDIS